MIYMQYQYIWVLYKLLILFLGSTVFSGHYFSFVKNSDQLWYFMNDESVKLISLDKVLS